MYGQNPYSQYPYTGYGYPTYGQRNYMQPQQPMAQPQMQQQVQQPMQPQYETPIQDIRFVTSEEAKAFIVMPNSKALLIDKNGGVAHLKTADNMGQSVTQYFKFEQVNADGTPLKPQETQQALDFSQFVTINQYNDLLGQFNDLKNMFQSTKLKQSENKPLTSDFNASKEILNRANNVARNG